MASITEPRSREAVPAVKALQERPRFPVVGVVASAGGLAAYERLLGNLPAESGMAVVLVPHLDPDQPRCLVTLLEKHASVPVVEIAARMPVEPNRVYVVPPNSYLELEDGRFSLSDPVPRWESQRVLDRFLHSLAGHCRDMAIGIVLSGTGEHGALGLKEIKANGGVVVAQDPGTAEFDDMPRGAIAAGVVDIILPPEKMASTLAAILRHSDTRVRPEGEIAETARESLHEILAFVGGQTGHDFGGYRENIVHRRIRRRMSLRQIDDMTAYLDLLKADAEATSELARDLLLPVSRFFRDPEAFRTVAAEAIAPLVRGKVQKTSLRVWVIGCATGEEAFSLAMLIDEHLAATEEEVDVQIFASDVDRGVLQVARSSRYPAAVAADIPPERLKKYFTREDKGTYRVRRTLREPVIFALHDVLSAPPFSRIDLISCRNLLGEFEPDRQRKLLNLLHFALADDGYLFLGRSETVDGISNQFEAVSPESALFRRIGPAYPAHFDRHRRQMNRDVESVFAQSRTPPRTHSAIVRETLLEKFAPAAILVNRSHRVVYFFGPTDAYVQIPNGEPSVDLLQIVAPAIHDTVRAALLTAARENRDVTVEPLRLPLNRRGSVQIGVRRVRSNDDLFLVTFAERQDDEAVEPVSAFGAEAGLKAELHCVREELQRTIQDLTAANEEMMSMNEELRSVNTELEVSKAELLVLNNEMARRVAARTAELETANTQMRNEVVERLKVEEALRGTNARLEMILRTASAGIVILDAHGGIESFNPAAERLFGYRETEVIGRTVNFLMPDHQDFLARYQSTEIANGNRSAMQEVVGVRKDGSTFPLDLLVSEFRVGGRRHFCGFFRDLSERREMEREMLASTAAVQQQIGQDLHDSVGQELTGLGLMAESLAESFDGRDDRDAQTARRIVTGVRSALGQVRALSQGLVPVEVDAHGLMAALNDLAARTAVSGVACTFDCDEPVSVEDKATATHLYHIAQEAVANALKHAHAHHIRIALRADPGRLVLDVADDGMGISDPLPESNGMGLKFMQHRASLVNATLTVGAARVGGTLVHCVQIRRDHHDDEKAD